MDVHHLLPGTTGGLPQRIGLDVAGIPVPAIGIAAQRIEGEVVGDAVLARGGAGEQRGVAGIWLKLLFFY
jgi:hypothetical protein